MNIRYHKYFHIRSSVFLSLNRRIFPPEFGASVRGPGRFGFPYLPAFPLIIQDIGFFPKIAVIPHQEDIRCSNCGDSVCKTYPHPPRIFRSPSQNIIFTPPYSLGICGLPGHKPANAFIIDSALCAVYFVYFITAFALFTFANISIANRIPEIFTIFQAGKAMYIFIILSGNASFEFISVVVEIISFIEVIIFAEISVAGFIPQIATSIIHFLYTHTFSLSSTIFCSMVSIITGVSHPHWFSQSAPFMNLIFIFII